MERVGALWVTDPSGVFWERGNWVLSAALLWHSGWPTTTLPAVIGEDEEVVLVSNDATLADYLSVDFRAARHWRRGEHEFSVFAELTNAFDRRNVGSLEVDLEEDEENGGFVSEQAPVEVLPWVPSIGFTWSF